MKSENVFYKELDFLEKNYNFEIGFFISGFHLDYKCYFYYSINEKEERLNIDDEFYKLFKVRSKKNDFCKLGMIVKEQLKQNKIFDYYF